MVTTHLFTFLLLLALVLYPLAWLIWWLGQVGFGSDWRGFLALLWSGGPLVILLHWWLALKRVYELIAGRRAMNADTALRLEKHFGMEARFWIDLQAFHDLSKARMEGSYDSIQPREAA